MTEPDSPDAVDSPKYVSTDRVQPTQHSERDKRQKFSKALKEKLEEELEKKRKRQEKDELVLGHDCDDESRGETESQFRESNESAADGGPTEQESQPGASGSEHVDLEA